MNFIHVDATELRTNSRLMRCAPELASLFKYPTTEDFIKKSSRTNLEELTGADVMLTQLGLPITPALLPKHVDSGATFIQLKFGRDLCGSIGDRMKESLWRMRQLGARQGQCMLIYIGTLSCGKDGKWAVINGQVDRPKREYSAVMTAIRHWIRRGGVYYPITKESALPQILFSIAEDIGRNGTVEEFYPEKVKIGYTDDPLEELKKIEDWRVPFANMNNDIGPMRATSLMEAMEAAGAAQNLGQALLWTSSPKKIRDELGVPRMRLWGPKSFESVRKMVFGEDGGEDFYLNVEVMNHD